MDHESNEAALSGCCGDASAAGPSASSAEAGVRDIDRRIDDLENHIRALKEKRAVLRRQRPPEPMSDYAFIQGDGDAVGWHALFDGNNELILVHNMGRCCTYCTLWADGFDGVRGHLESRAAFVVTSPDPPAEQRAFAESRDWSFRMYSVGMGFLADLGFIDANGEPTPGVSFLERRDDGSVWRTQRADFGPGDEFCPTWHLLDLLPQGTGSWEPQASYPRR